MPSPHQQFGSWAESVAEDFLRRKNYLMLARHVTSRFGEIDILALDRNMLVAIEVKARRNQFFGRAIENITERKLERIMLTLSELLQISYWPEERVRIDVVTVEPAGIKHIAGIG